YKDWSARMSVTAGLITGNQAVGGNGTGTGNGGSGIGGGIDNVSDPTGAAALTISSSALIGNQAVGGTGAAAGRGDGGGIDNAGRSGKTAGGTGNPRGF